MKSSLHDSKQISLNIRAASFVRTLSMVTVLFCLGITGIHRTSVAEVTDRQYEASLKERKRDFDAFAARRNKSSEQELESAAALKKSREARKIEREKQLLGYRKTMIRYSMEATEARDQAYEKTLQGRDAEKDLDRSRFVLRRERRKAIAERSPRIDPYEEFQININVAPESKASATGVSGETPP